MAISDPNLIIRPTRESDFEPYREMRLEALKNHSEAFASDYEHASTLPDDHWPAVVARPAGRRHRPRRHHRAVRRAVVATDGRRHLAYVVLNALGVGKFQFRRPAPRRFLLSSPATSPFLFGIQAVGNGGLGAGISRGRFALHFRLILAESLLQTIDFAGQAANGLLILPAEAVQLLQEIAQILN